MPQNSSNTGNISDDSQNVVIEGINEEGRVFRPSDWCERLATTLAEFGKDGRLQYTSGVMPCIIGGVRCLVIAKNLEQQSPDSYAFLMDFAKSNKLRVQLDRRGKDVSVPTDRRHNA